MAGIIGPPNQITTTGQPLAGIIGHLGHLGKPLGAEQVLRQRFHCPRKDARAGASVVAAHIEQALEFHRMSKTVSYRVKPVLQYYAYLNLAVATVLCYRPPGYSKYRSHGLHDATGQLKSLMASSVVVKVSNHGAVPLFHAVLSDATLPKKLKLRELFVSIAMISAEVSAYLGMTAMRIRVHPEIEDTNPAAINSPITSHLPLLGATDLNRLPLPRAPLQRAIPRLASDYVYSVSGKETVTYRSKQTWTAKEKAEAVQWH